ncbi:D-2-hydroxyacid dehydrogenase [[Clostridium] innocuum]|nr:D-2-hydroxyacid dehydrogenase [Erysipelotrichaceae bacterium]MCR0383975.1 D-2-hydroxyacid dehydrogenase [[Clostridium] innocuum]MCR0414726.1 D-2-hydroxyacid dehydrogenase [[Clostridium] innocuum]MCR0535662.1 D-2-hydroxyacid dehydrogenase [[Clostridium] innocuum]MCR0540434.1 D-2-hydroxyacid dehydrogenase [[Clostridium] innocuum]
MKMSRDKLHLLELSGFEREQLARIPDSYIVTCSDAKCVSAAMVKEADVIIGRVPKELLGNAQRLRLLQLDCAGSEQYTADGLLPKDCQLCNASGSFGLAISEYLICTILMLMRNMNLYIRNQEQAYWHMEGPVQSIYGSTILIAGTGDLGQEFAKRVKAMGAYTIGIRRRVQERAPYFDELHTMEELCTLLPRADVVVLALPSTEKTRGCFGSEQLACMKTTAILVNVGRGDALSCDELLQAIQQKQLSGAVLDVCDREPLAKEHPLWKQPNVIITPHISGTFQLKESFYRFTEIALYNLQAFLEHKELKNVVDRKLGYRVHTVDYVNKEIE